jgi:hypothetical protein
MERFPTDWDKSAARCEGPEMFVEEVCNKAFETAAEHAASPG